MYPPTASRSLSPVLLLALSALLLPCFVRSEDSGVISLYDADLDNVIELVDSNVTASIFDSEFLWVVEFYAHWCGHCQRFAPTWVEVAKQFAGWDKHVKIAAINCAQQQECADYDIRGTPTIRAFYPNTPAAEGNIGENINLELHTADYLKGEVLRRMASMQTQGQSKPDMPSLQYYSPISFLQFHSDVESSPDKITALVMESQNNPNLGSEVILKSGQDLQNVLVKKVHYQTAVDSFTNILSGVIRYPALVTIKGTDTKIFYPALYGPPAEVQMVEKIMALESNNSSDVEGFESTTLRPPSETDNTYEEEPHSGESSNNGEVQPNHPDVVHASDLERAIEYAVFNEIPTQNVLDSDRINTLYNFFGVIAKYAPVRKEIKQFLVSLREWPVQQKLRNIDSEDFTDKARELASVYRPFDGTPDDWQSCRGSQPHLRGYPCSVWTLFHTLLANAAVEGDASMKFGGPSTVAQSMVQYIHFFFSCRHCAENFALKVQSLGYIPTTPQDSILWLWQIHNMANNLLKDDLTEDPEHPKITWPSAENCPLCRAQPYGQVEAIPVQGELWNVRETAAYLIKVYRKENVVPNNVRITSELKEKRISEMKSLMAEALERLKSDYDNNSTNTGGDNSSSGLELKLSSLIVINEYCATVFDKMNEN